MILTKGMLKALSNVGYGVSATPKGYRCIDNKDEILDLRSADALKRRGLIFYTFSGGKGALYLTAEGEKIFEDSIRG